MQPNLSLGIVNALGMQQLIQPCQRTPLRRRATIAMVDIVKRQQRAAIDGQVTTAVKRHAAHGQQQKPSGIGKRMATGSIAGVAHLAGSDQRDLVRQRKCGDCQAASSCIRPCTIACAALRPAL